MKKHSSPLSTVTYLLSTLPPLLPLLALGTITLLCIAVFASYARTANRQSVVILPGGVTYTGK